MLILWPIALEVLEKFGYKKGDKIFAIMICGVYLASTLGQPMFPFKGASYVVVSAFERMSGMSVNYGAYIAYNIIMSSEILGLSHLEREIIALTVLYNTLPLENYEELAEQIDKESYLVVAKLSAILRVANALDQSHKQKFKNIRVSMKERELIITVEAFENIALEQTLFENKTSYFENVFSMKPVLREKRIYEL